MSLVKKVSYGEGRWECTYFFRLYSLKWVLTNSGTRPFIDY